MSNGENPVIMSSLSSPPNAIHTTFLPILFVIILPTFDLSPTPPHTHTHTPPTLPSRRPRVTATTPITPPMLLLDTCKVTEVVSHPLPSAKLPRHRPFTIDLLDIEIVWVGQGVWFVC